MLFECTRKLNYKLLYTIKSLCCQVFHNDNSIYIDKTQNKNLSWNTLHRDCDVKYRDNYSVVPDCWYVSVCLSTHMIHSPWVFHLRNRWEWVGRRYCVLLLVRFISPCLMLTAWVRGPWRGPGGLSDCSTHTVGSVTYTCCVHLYLPRGDLWPWIVVTLNTRYNSMFALVLNVCPMEWS